MEERNLKKTPRAGPSYAGESRLPASGSCRAYTGPAQTALCEDEGVVTTRRKEEEGLLSRTGPGLVNITPGPGPLTDEDVDFSQPQENGTERLLRLMHRKKMRGDDDIPETVKHRDIRGMTPTPLPLQGARGSQSRVALTRGLDIPAPPTGRRHPGYDSEDWRSDTDMSSISVDSEGLPAIPGRDTPRKRRTPGDDGAPSLRKEAVPKPKRGRGRPPTTGKYVGRAAVRAELNRQNEEALRLEAEAEAEVADMARAAREARASCQVTPVNTDSEEYGTSEQSSFALALSVEASLALVTKVATSSKSLKETYIKHLKDAVTNIREAVSELRSRSTTEEMSRLESQNARLEKQVAELRRELDELRRRPAQPSTGDVQQLLSEVSRSNIETFGNMLNARLAGLEDRLLPEPRIRPPLVTDASADTPPAHAACNGVGPKPSPAESTPSRAIPEQKKKAPKPRRAKAPQPEKTGVAAPTSAAPPKAPKGKKKKKKRPSMAAQEAARGTAYTSPPSAEAPWTTVGPRKAKKKKEAATPAKVAPQRKKAAKLRAPRTAAVALTLEAGAAERGLTYAKILAEAKAKIDLGELSIPRIGFRIAETGARLLTISGEGAQEKADALAARLRSALANGDVRVGRPVACAEIRVAGLDDSATAADVIQAAARDGGCPAGDIRSGPVTFGPRGDGAIWLPLPIAAAKKLAGSGRLRVGWVTARVALLASRPKRCFRCQDKGHVAVNCKCADDRSGMCFRCGAQGHKAAECGATEPNCFLCEAAGREERGHVLGSSACVAASKPVPATRKRKASAKPGPRRPKANRGGVSAARRTAPAPVLEAMET